MRGREESSDHEGIIKTRIFLKDCFSSEKSFNTEAKRCFATNDEDIDSIECVYIQQFNTYAVQSGGCRFESLWGFGFIILKPSTINLSQESPNKSIQIVMLDVIFIKIW